MIEQLTINRLGVIEHASIAPGRGFTALTGETGAGKTLVLTALGLLLGGKADAGLTERSSVEGVFSVPEDGPAARAVAEAGGMVDDGELILSRTAVNGRMRAVAGGRTVPASLLGQIAEELVVVHGQSSQQRLRQPSAQLAALDRLGGSEHLAQVEEHRAAFQAWRAADATARSAGAEQAQRTAAMDALRSGLDDIESVDPQPGELAELLAEQTRLANLAELQSRLGQAAEAVIGDDSGENPGAAGLLAAARQLLAGAVGLDPGLEGLLDRLVAAVEETSDLGHELSARLDSLQAAPGRLEWLGERIQALQALCSRFGGSEQAVADWAQKAVRELTALEQQADAAALAERAEALAAAVRGRAERLTAARAALAERLAASATAEIRHLAMPNAEIAVEVAAAALGPDGADEVTILLRPHPGARAAPVAKAASGGELSRVMLALEVVLADTRGGRSFIFDEVDAGVGGAAATAIGRRLARLGRNAQVIVVTHMPQVAAWADTHLRVHKSQDQAVTISDVRALDDQERVVEIARMLAGQEDSEHARAHAQELLSLADEAVLEA